VLDIGEERIKHAAPNKDIPEDKLYYSQTMAQIIKPHNDIPMLLETSEEMLDEDIIDCIQALHSTNQNDIQNILF